MFRAEIIGTMSTQSAAAISDRSPNYTKAWQILIQRSQAIINPLSDRWKLSLQRMSAGMKLQLGSVIIIRCPH